MKKFKGNIEYFKSIFTSHFNWKISTEEISLASKNLKFFGGKVIIVFVFVFPLSQRSMIKPKIGKLFHRISGKTGSEIERKGKKGIKSVAEFRVWFYFFSETTQDNSRQFFIWSFFFSRTSIRFVCLFVVNSKIITNKFNDCNKTISREVFELNWIELMLWL